MKGTLSDIYGTSINNFDFELSETPKDLILRLVSSHLKESMIALFSAESDYDETKSQNHFDTNASMFGFAPKDTIPIILSWDQPLQKQISKQAEVLQASGKEIPFIANITRVVA